MLAKLGKRVELIKLNEAFGFSLEFNQVYTPSLPLPPGEERDDTREGGGVIYPLLRLNMKKKWLLSRMDNTLVFARFPHLVFWDGMLRAFHRPSTCEHLPGTDGKGAWEANTAAAPPPRQLMCRQTVLTEAQGPQCGQVQVPLHLNCSEIS